MTRSLAWSTRSSALPPPATTWAGTGKKGSWRRYGERMFARAMDDNISQIAGYLDSVGTGTGSRILDLGCGDGDAYVRYAPRGSRLFGIEGSPADAAAAAARGIRVIVGDLDGVLPFKDGSFDVVTSNQVIEHLSDTDSFVSETWRLLRPGGCVAASTENLSSWHNIGSLLLGWQAFSLTNVSQIKAGLGNPFAVVRSDHTGLGPGWQHRRIFSYRGLLELFRCHGFTDVGVRAAGYYPLPTRAARLDPRHAAFLTVVGRRP